MKHQECVYMPSTVEDWLREQLVKRGIDAVLFTQYILNLIQSVLISNSDVFFNNFEDNCLEMLVSELCVNLIDAIYKCEVVSPFLDPDQCISNYCRDYNMYGLGSKARHSEHSSLLQDSQMELHLQALLGEDEVPVLHTEGPRSQQKCRRDLYLAFTQSLSQKEVKQDSTIPLGYTAYNDLGIPQVDFVDQDTDSRCDKFIEVSSDGGSPKTEDRNLARLIAKFDSSIEALWNPDGSLNGPDFTETSEEFNSSFQQLDPSPIPMDIPSSKQNSISFLPYGSDISSIWSSQPSPEELVMKSLEITPEAEATEWSMPEPMVECLDEVKESLAALNHSKEGSSFMEVKPKKKPFTLETLLNPSPLQESKMEPVEKRRKEKEEEPVDLLESQTTHFSPIRKEARTTSKRHYEATRYETTRYETTRYADGTTFEIPDALERINYTRSASGALYLEEEGSSPKKFMEFRTMETDFVPKFRVSQNEKCCQTDTIDDFDSEDKSKAPTCAQLNVKCLEKDLEEEIEDEVEEEVRKMIEGRAGKKGACYMCGNPSSWATEWRWNTDAQPGQTPITKIWAGNFTLMTLEPASQRGYPAWSDADGGSNGLCSKCGADAEHHKSQLRQELILEGEQLLIDLNLNSLSYLLDEKRDHSEALVFESACVQFLGRQLPASAFPFFS